MSKATHLEAGDDTMSSSALSYETTITTSGVSVPFVPEIITPALEKPMRNSRYEGGEVLALREGLRPGDRVLELGAGVGLLSTIAATTEGVDSVVAVEANPEMIPLIEETHRLNGADNVTLLNGVVTPSDGDKVSFYLRRDFWASSMEPDSRPYVRAVDIRTFGIEKLIADHDPTVIVCDIEGGELGLFDGVDLSNVRLMVMEFHPKVYGQRQVEALYDLFARKGLQITSVEKPTTVRKFTRPVTPAEAEAWPPGSPRFFVSTCMKDEGPFILEWIAWHKSLGIDDFVVFTNDCTDGTDLILDRLESLGHLRHLPNPALATGSTYFQPVALAYTPHLREWRTADFFISMDVDEFINIRVGSGKMSDLLAAAGFFDALSMSELNHGSNGVQEFEPGLMIEQFPLHQTERPGPRKALRGVKTIVRLSEKLDKPRNHRPDFRGDHGPVTWLDGSARPLGKLHEDASLNGIDVRGSYDLVSLDHFPLRSLDSYLIKMFRGDVVVKNNRVSHRYWRLRNKNEQATSTFERQQAGFRAALGALMEDPELRRLHDRACDIHRERAVALLEKPEFRERRDWILENAWDADPR
ncbi:MAG: FkbM family methyltransferase [Pseudomonadota bacterium]